jgi:crotonobetainyl-CoA:carnitine CoA-transferase CaiB-like acyl-CoA transferase
MRNWKPFTNADRPLAGIRVLSMEQAAALPFATRHLADLGAYVIRVQSHNRGAAGGGIEADATRNKRQLAVDLSRPGGPELFLRLAAACDVVAHNFTPKVMRRYGIDYEGVRAVNPQVIYVSLTGFGTTGPWGERPLFGPGSEAVSGHNLLIGEADAWPGRPGTIVYSDNTCGLNCAFAVLAALDERDRTGRGQHIDISLYETSVSHLGAAVSERAFGAPLPVRIGNRDGRYAVHGVFKARGHDRHVAVAARRDQLDDLERALGLERADEDAIEGAIASLEAADAAARLQASGVAASAVADASEQVSDSHLWARGFFGRMRRSLPGFEGDHPHAGPAWGDGASVEMAEPGPTGADSRAVLREVLGLTVAEIDGLYASGVTGEMQRAAPPSRESAESVQVAVERGELSRADAVFDGWKSAMAEARRD